jgi:N utilization substance protein A
MVVNELNGEKVDIISFSEDPYEFVAKALSPAKVKEVRIDESTGTATVIVPDFQLSLAIGKEGQNARLAHRLTGWRIDIKSETQLAEEELAADDYTNTEEWADGEWIVDEESGEQKWQPADGSKAMTLEEWTAGGRDEDMSDDAPAEANKSDSDEPADEEASSETAAETDEEVEADPDSAEEAASAESPDDSEVVIEEASSEDTSGEAATEEPVVEEEATE